MSPRSTEPAAHAASSGGLRKRAKRSAKKLRGWVMWQWMSRTEPRVVEVLESADSVERLHKLLAAVIKRDGIEAASAVARSACEHAAVLRRFNAPINVHVAAIRALHEVAPQEALRFGEACFPANAEPRNYHTLALHHRLAGNYPRAIELLDRIGEDPAVDANTRQARIELRFEAEMELELARLLAAFPDERAARDVADRMFSGRDDRELTTVVRLLTRNVLHPATESATRRWLVSRFDELLACPLPPGATVEISAAYLKVGELTKARTALDRGTGDEPRTELQRRTVESLVDLAARGFTYTPARQTYAPEEGRVLYAIHSSLPYHSAGYATRSHGLLGGIAAYQWRASGITRLGYPQDLYTHQATPVEASSVVDRVTYLRMPRPGALFNTLPKIEYLRDYADALCAVARVERPQLLHAAADCHNGLAANAAARSLGIKSIYEVRGLWEVTRGSRDPDWAKTEHFKLMSDLEAQAAREADAVVVITRALGDEMVRRGVPRDKITLVPNGVDVARFTPRPRDEALAAKLGLRGKRVIGYIGSIVDYEGLDLLLHAVHQLSEKEVAVLIVGDGPVLDSLKALARSLGIEQLVVFTGRVPHHEVEAYYSLIDIAPFPRKSLPVTEMVSPLKPLEAMAMNKHVVASDVAALAEMIVPGVNGVTFEKDNVEDLARVLARLLGEGKTATPRAWVESHRSWQTLAGLVDGLYRQLLR